MDPQRRYRPTWRAYAVGVFAWVLMIWATGIVQVWGTGPAVRGIRVRLRWTPASLMWLLAISIIACLVGEMLWRARRSSESNA